MPTPATAESSAASPSPDDPVATDLPRSLNAAVRKLVRYGSGSFAVSVDDPDGAGAGTGIVVDSTGVWDIRKRLGLTRVSTLEGEGDPVEINTIFVKGDAWTQALYAGSDWVPDCWSVSNDVGGTSELLLPAAIMAVLDLDGRVAEGRTEPTMLASDVLGSIGMQKAANELVGSDSDGRVPVEPVITSGVLSGWSVLGADLSPYLVPLLGGQGSGVEEALESLTWSVDYSALGEPVRVGPPSRGKIIAPGETCAS